MIYLLSSFIVYNIKKILWTVIQKEVKSCRFLPPPPPLPHPYPPKHLPPTVVFIELVELKMTANNCDSEVFVFIGHRCPMTWSRVFQTFICHFPCLCYKCQRSWFRSKSWPTVLPTQTRKMTNKSLENSWPCW